MTARGASTSARAFVALLAARAAFGLYYLGSTLRDAPIPWYHPLERAWTFEARPASFAMDWFGRTALALLCGLVAGGAVWIASGVPAWSRWLGRPGVTLAVARAGALVLLVDFAYFGWVLTHREPAPLPLPSWYCPR